DFVTMCSWTGWKELKRSDEHDEATRVFRKSREVLQGPFDLLVVHHFLSRGGSEKETFLSLAAIARVMPELRVGVLVSEPHDSPRAWQVPRGMPVLELGHLMVKLGREQRQFLLFRLLLQLKPDVINNVISPTCWDVFSRYSDALAEHSKLVTTLF